MAEYPTAFPRRPMRPTPPVVGVLGYARAGKDSIAARLVERHGFVRYAFADALKAAALDLDPIVGHTSTVRLSDVVGDVGWEAAKGMPEVRRTLQNLGVAMRDRIGESVWVDTVMSQVDRDARPVVITDVRFPNEVAAIGARRGVLVRVLRPGAAGDAHISEQTLAHTAVDYAINNQGTLDELHTAVDRIVFGLADNSPMRGVAMPTMTPAPGRVWHSGLCYVRSAS